MTRLETAILCIIAAGAILIFFYFLSKLQMKAWISVIEQFLNEKSAKNKESFKSKLKTKENEKQKEKQFQKSNG